MSYILDALKKAESERERGAVPGLNSAQANQSTFIHYGSDQKPWWLIAMVLGLALVLVFAVWAWRQVVVPPETKAPTAAVQKPDLPARAPVLAPVPAPVPKKANPLEAATSAVAHVQAKVVVPSAGPTMSATPVAPATPAKPTQTATPTPPAAAVAPEPISKPAPVATPIRSASGGVPMLSELPEPMRRQIPALNISGAVYSDSPPEWTLIINDQLMGKGSQVAPDVRLEEISGSSAVFNFKGQRFRIDR